VTAVKSGKTDVGHSPIAGNALFAGTSGAGASVTSTTVVVSSTNVVSTAAEVLDEPTESSPPQALIAAIDNDPTKMT
jgi:hypothetical protein